MKYKCNRSTKPITLKPHIINQLMIIIFLCMCIKSQQQHNLQINEQVKQNSTIMIINQKQMYKIVDLQYQQLVTIRGMVHIASQYFGDDKQIKNNISTNMHNSNINNNSIFSTTGSSQNINNNSNTDNLHTYQCSYTIILASKHTLMNITCHPNTNIQNTNTNTNTNNNTKTNDNNQVQQTKQIIILYNSTQYMQQQQYNKHTYILQHYSTYYVINHQQYIVDVDEYNNKDTSVYDNITIYTDIGINTIIHINISIYNNTIQLIAQNNSNNIIYRHYVLYLYALLTLITIAAKVITMQYKANNSNSSNSNDGICNSNIPLLSVLFSIQISVFVFNNVLVTLYLYAKHYYHIGNSNNNSNNSQTYSVIHLIIISMILLCTILTIVYHIYQALNIMLTIIHKYSINNNMMNNNNNNNNNMSIIRKYSINIMCYLILILSTIFIYRIHKDITTYLVLSVGMLYYMSGFVVCKQKRTRTKKQRINNSNATDHINDDIDKQKQQFKIGFIISDIVYLAALAINSRIYPISHYQIPNIYKFIGIGLLIIVLLVYALITYLYINVVMRDDTALLQQSTIQDKKKNSQRLGQLTMKKIGSKSQLQSCDNYDSNNMYEKDQNRMDKQNWKRVRNRSNFSSQQNTNNATEIEPSNSNQMLGKKVYNDSHIQY